MSKNTMLNDCDSALNKVATGQFIGVGVGPGDPELLTLKAARVIQQADVLCYLVNDQGHSHGLAIAHGQVQARTKNVEHMPIFMPMDKNPRVGEAVYAEAAQTILNHMKADKCVAFLCEGDPLFFGSFAYLLLHIQSAVAKRSQCDVIPGITSPQAAASVLHEPLTLLKESYVVVSGRHDDHFIKQALLTHDTVVIMKAGSSRPRLLSILTETQRTQDARYLAFIGRENQELVSDVSTLNPDEVGPYFSLFMVMRSQRGRK